MVEEPGKKLPKKMIIRIFILCFSFMAVILLVVFILPGMLQLSTARKDFYAGNYEAAYEGLIGQDLNKSDQILLEKSQHIVNLERKVNAYEAYKLAGSNAEALNALMEGVALYQKNISTYDELGISGEADAAYVEILILLQNEYAIDESRALEILAMDGVAYTYEIRRLTGTGAEVSSDENEQQEEGGPQEEQQDGQESSNEPDSNESEPVSINVQGTSEDDGQTEVLEDMLEEEME